MNPFALACGARQDVVPAKLGPLNYLKTSIFNQRGASEEAPAHHIETRRAKRSGAARRLPAAKKLRITDALWGVNRPKGRISPEIRGFPGFRRVCCEGERPDLNRRPPGPQPGALTT